MIAPLAVSTTGAVLAIIGLVIGLVVLVVVINLLQGTLTPLRRVLTDVKSAKTAPMLERGVPGTDQLGTTRRLADSVPPLALAYLNKLGASPAAPAYAPAPAAAPAYAPPSPAPASAGAETASTDDYIASVQPAWKRYSS